MMSVEEFDKHIDDDGVYQGPEEWDAGSISVIALRDKRLVSLGKLKSFVGKCLILGGNVKSLGDLEEVHGFLEIEEGCLEAKHLNFVEETLFIGGPSLVELPAMMSVKNVDAEFPPRMPGLGVSCYVAGKVHQYYDSIESDAEKIGPLEIVTALAVKPYLKHFLEYKLKKIG